LKIEERGRRRGEARGGERVPARTDRVRAFRRQWGWVPLQGTFDRLRCCALCILYVHCYYVPNHGNNTASLGSASNSACSTCCSCSSCCAVTTSTANAARRNNSATNVSASCCRNDVDDDGIVFVVVCLFVLDFVPFVCRRRGPRRSEKKQRTGGAFCFARVCPQNKKVLFGI